MKKLRKLRVLVSVVGCLIRIRIKTLCHLLDFMQHPLQMQSNNQHCSPPNWHLLGVVVLDVVKMCSNKFDDFYLYIYLIPYLQRGQVIEAKTTPTYPANMVKIALDDNDLNVSS